MNTEMLQRLFMAMASGKTDPLTDRQLEEAKKLLNKEDFFHYARGMTELTLASITREGSEVERMAARHLLEAADEIDAIRPRNMVNVGPQDIFMTPKQYLDPNLVSSLVKQNKGKVFTVTFVKEDGSTRTMNCRTGVKTFLTGNGNGPNFHNPQLINVYDLKKHGYRCFNRNRVKEIKIGKKSYSTTVFQ